MKGGSRRKTEVFFTSAASVTPFIVAIARGYCGLATAFAADFLFFFLALGRLPFFFW
jgi:hypothetical protein